MASGKADVNPADEAIAAAAVEPQQAAAPVPDVVGWTAMYSNNKSKWYIVNLLNPKERRWIGRDEEEAKKAASEAEADRLKADTEDLTKDDDDQAPQVDLTQVGGSEAYNPLGVGSGGYGAASAAPVNGGGYGMMPTAQQQGWGQPQQQWGQASPIAGQQQQWGQPQQQYQQQQPNYQQQPPGYQGFPPPNANGSQQWQQQPPQQQQYHGR
jgi:hypothetical protein